MQLPFDRSVNKVDNKLINLTIGLYHLLESDKKPE